jgi:hypothetical protein
VDCCLNSFTTVLLWYGMHSTHLSYHAMINPAWMEVHTKIEMVFTLAIFNYELYYERCTYYTLPITVIFLEYKMDNMKFISTSLYDALFTIHHDY